MGSGPTFHDDDPILQRLQELEDRVATLERTRQLENASIKGGALKILDDQDRLVAQVGKLADGTHGLDLFNASTAERVVRLDASGAVTVSDADGNVVARFGVLAGTDEFGLETFDPATGASVLQIGKLAGSLGNGLQILNPDQTSHAFLVTDELGQSTPWQLLPLGSSSTQLRARTSSSSFVEAFLADFAATAGELSWNLAVAPPSGSEMEVRATLAPIGGSEVTLATRSYTAGQQDLWEFPNAIADGDIGSSFRLRIKHRLVSGSGEAATGVVTHPINRA